MWIQISHLPHNDLISKKLLYFNVYQYVLEKKIVVIKKNLNLFE